MISVFLVYVIQCRWLHNIGINVVKLIGFIKPLNKNAGGIILNFTHLPHNSPLDEFQMNLSTDVSRVFLDDIMYENFTTTKNEFRIDEEPMFKRISYDTLIINENIRTK